MNAQSGFSLVELIVVIIVLGVIGLTVAPRFVSTAGFSEYALQQRLQSALRTIQTKAMNDTSNLTCYRVVFDTTEQTMGPTASDYVNTTVADACGATIAESSPLSLRFASNELADLDVQMTTSDGGITFNQVTFDSLGRPATDVGNCVGTCTISLQGENTTRVCIGNEGYVYAC